MKELEFKDFAQFEKDVAEIARMEYRGRDSISSALMKPIRERLALQRYNDSEICIKGGMPRDTKIQPQGVDPEILIEKPKEPIVIEKPKSKKRKKGK